MQDLRQLVPQATHVFAQQHSSNARVVLRDPSCMGAAIAQLNGVVLRGQVLKAEEAPTDALLFVGNVDASLDDRTFRELFTAFGVVVRAFVMRFPESGASKNYGFVEFATVLQAERAKKELAAKVIGDRAIRIDWMDGNATTLKALHSCTLFIDRLPRKLLSIDSIVARCNEIAPVKFHRIALSHGNSRGFGFLDFYAGADAARVQEILNNTVVDGVTVRLSFGNPCKTGEQILGGPQPPAKKKMAQQQQPLRPHNIENSDAGRSDFIDNITGRHGNHHLHGQGVSAVMQASGPTSHSHIWRAPPQNPYNFPVAALRHHYVSCEAYYIQGRPVQYMPFMHRGQDPAPPTGYTYTTPWSEGDHHPRHLLYPQQAAAQQPLREVQLHEVYGPELGQAERKRKALFQPGRPTILRRLPSHDRMLVTPQREVVTYNEPVTITPGHAHLLHRGVPVQQSSPQSLFFQPIAGKSKPPVNGGSWASDLHCPIEIAYAPGTHYMGQHMQGLSGLAGLF